MAFRATSGKNVTNSVRPPWYKATFCYYDVTRISGYFPDLRDFFDFRGLFKAFRVTLDKNVTKNFSLVWSQATVASQISNFTPGLKEAFVSSCSYNTKYSQLPHNHHQAVKVRQNFGARAPAAVFVSFRSGAPSCAPQIFQERCPGSRSGLHNFQERRSSCAPVFLCLRSDTFLHIFARLQVKLFKK